MELRHLEFFLRVSELGSINRAASTLSLSQPALSRYIAALEHEMGTPLFSRTQGGVKLTDAGKLLHERVRPLLRQFQVLKEQVGEEAAGQVAVGLPPAWQGLLTGVFIERFAQRHPRVKLRIYEGLSNVLHDHMAAGLLDMCVVPFRPMPFSGYRRSALARESLALVGQASDGLDSNRMVPISRLQGEDLIMPEKPNALRLQIEHSIERLGIECRVTIETDALGVCLDLARRGVGMTIVPYSALVGDAALAGLSWSPIKGQQITWALLENESREHAQVCREVRKGLIAALARTLADGHWKHAEGMVS